MKDIPSLFQQLMLQVSQVPDEDWTTSNSFESLVDEIPGTGTSGTLLIYLHY